MQAASKENFTVILITDKPRLHNSFPGQIIKYKRGKNKKILHNFNRRYPEKKTLAGGYWLNTIERIFALNSLEGVVDGSSQIIHVESDVYTYFTADVIRALEKSGLRAAIPRFSPERGIGSVMYFKNYRELEESIKTFAEITELKDIENDMELFGHALNSSLIAELPSTPSSAWKLEPNMSLLFDGASFGQYLFGQDPFHQNGKLVSGYVNPFSTVNYAESKWNMEEYNGNFYPSFRYQGEKYLLANLHLHSKEIIPRTDEKSEIWTRVFNEANGLVERTNRASGIRSVHSKKPSIYTRLQMARRIGYRETFKRIKRKILH